MKNVPARRKKNRELKRKNRARELPAREMLKIIMEKEEQGSKRWLRVKGGGE